MNEIHDDFGTTLTALLDDVAAEINPRADFDAVFSAQLSMTTNPSVIPNVIPLTARRPFRRATAVAAAALLLVGGGAAAYSAIDGDEESVVSSELTTDKPVPTSTTAPTTIAPVVDDRPEADGDVTADAGDDKEPRPPTSVVRTAVLGDARLDATPPKQTFKGNAAPGERVTVTTPYGHAKWTANARGRWSATVMLDGAQPGERIPALVTFEHSDIEIELAIEMPAPPPTPTTAPAPLVTEPPATTTTTTAAPLPTFTAVLGWTEGTGMPLKVGLWGDAIAGSTITVGSEHGSGSVVATAAGTWEIIVELHEVPPGGKVPLRVTSSTSDKVYEFTAKAPPAEPEPVSKPFTAELGAGDLGAMPMKQLFHGTGAPGSVVRIGSDYGVAEVVVGEKGYWEAKLKAEVPYGVVVHVRITNSHSDAVFEFDLPRPEAPAHDFTAQAAFVECDSTPPFNEYWGKAAPGATVTIESPYGGSSVTANGEGTWEARIEFPDAPVGEKFIVRITSSQGGKVFELPMKRI